MPVDAVQKGKQSQEPRARDRAKSTMTCIRGRWVRCLDNGFPKGNNVFLPPMSEGFAIHQVPFYVLQLLKKPKRWIYPPMVFHQKGISISNPTFNGSVTKRVLGGVVRGGPGGWVKPMKVLHQFIPDETAPCRTDDSLPECAPCCKCFGGCALHCKPLKSQASPDLCD